jgi:hypothetical protein
LAGREAPVAQGTALRPSVRPLQPVVDERKREVKNRKQRILNAVLARAATDQAFRQRLISEPRTALRDTFGLDLPESYRLKFVERDADLDALVVLPDFKGTAQDDELQEDELQAVGGGLEAGSWSFYEDE